MGKPFYFMENLSGWPSAGRAFNRKPFRILLKVRLARFWSGGPTAVETA